MSENVVQFGCVGRPHSWGEVVRAELVDVSEWVERSTCERCGARQEVYFENGEEAAREILDRKAL